MLGYKNIWGTTNVGVRWLATMYTKIETSGEVVHLPCRDMCNTIKVYKIDDLVCASYQKNNHEESEDKLENLRKLNVIAQFVGGDKADSQGHQSVAHGQETKHLICY